MLCCREPPSSGKGRETKLDGRHSPQSVTTALSTSLSPSFKLRPERSVGVTKEDRAPSRVLLREPQPTQPLWISSPKKALEDMDIAAASGITSCSYRTLERHYKNDTLRMLKRIQGARNRAKDAVPYSPGAEQEAEQLDRDELDDHEDERTIHCSADLETDAIFQMDL
mmetsp:Transcript_20119/g.32463  ORF Transcript_20119/g.32463 Transcript_20119/m.32463 type:complete len:168 (+) Transcript_20119:111-614(+)